MKPAIFEGVNPALVLRFSEVPRGASCPSWGRRLAVVLAASLLAFAAVAPGMVQAQDKPLKNTDKPLGAEKPLPLKEVCLLLRGGYTSGEVLREVATRRLLDPVDPAAEKQLLAAGADAALVNALKAGNYNLSAADAAAARQRLAASDQREQAARNAVLAHQQSQAAAPPQQLPAQAAQPAPPQSPLAPAKSPFMANMLRGQLVTFHDGQFQRYDDARLAGKKLYAVYFSASWCGPCQKFTPMLENFYEHFEQLHPEFEVIFFSGDRSAEEMQRYMQADHMTWAAVPFAALAQMPWLSKLAGDGIPDLVLLDDSGRVLSDSYRGGKYVGPSEVVKDLMALVGTPVAGR